MHTQDVGDARDLTSIRHDVVRENRLAAHSGLTHSQEIDPRDPRWILAMQTQARLQGSTLTPERRDELLASGSKLGLHPFESNLVIAVVQDHARRSQPLRLAMPAATGMIGLSALPRPRSTEATRNLPMTWRWWIAALATASMIAMFCVRWLTDTP